MNKKEAQKIKNQMTKKFTDIMDISDVKKNIRRLDEIIKEGPGPEPKPKPEPRRRYESDDYNYDSVDFLDDDESYDRSMLKTKLVPPRVLPKKFRADSSSTPKREIVLEDLPPPDDSLINFIDDEVDDEIDKVEDDIKKIEENASNKDIKALAKNIAESIVEGASEPDLENEVRSAAADLDSKTSGGFWAGISNSRKYNLIKGKGLKNRLIDYAIENDIRKNKDEKPSAYFYRVADQMVRNV
jgi:hypothetical protein